MTKIYIAITLFGLTATFGMYLFSLVMRNKSTPKGITIVHGLMAVVALVLLLVYAFQNEVGPWPSIIVFTVAALGGLILNYRDMTGKSVPKWLAVVHGSAAVTGFALLLWFAFK